MKNLKQNLLRVPEYLLIIGVIIYWISAGMGINPIAIVLFAILVLQVIIKSRFIGLIVSSLLIVSCLYLLLALISEVSEFPTFNAAAKKMLFVGLSLFIPTIIVAGIMFYRDTLSDIFKKP